MGVTVCLAPAHTVAYPKGGGHFWVYLQWALGLRSLGCDVVWLEQIDPTQPADAISRDVEAIRKRLAFWNFDSNLALTTPDGSPLPGNRHLTLDLDAAVRADLLINLWHSLPAAVVQRFRRTALVDTDPGLLQTWMTEGSVSVAPHDCYFTIGETVGARSARFPDCGLRWLYTPPPIFLPEWPALPVNGATTYTTVAHWWGGTFAHNGTTFWNEKRVAFLDYLELPARTRVQLEAAVCLVDHFDEFQRLMEPKGWRLRQAWDVTSTPQDYRAYVQQSRGEFSCAKPAYVALETAWVSDRTLCYLASGRPAIVQHTGPSRLLPDGEGLFRFRTLEEAAAALMRAEADYDRHARLARALVAEHFDAERVVAHVLERALN